MASALSAIEVETTPNRKLAVEHADLVLMKSSKSTTLQLQCCSVSQSNTRKCLSVLPLAREVHIEVPPVVLL